MTAPPASPNHHGSDQHMHDAQTTEPIELTPAGARRRLSRRRWGSVADETGQTTAEYALVLIAAATIAMLIVAWAANTGAIGEFFDSVIDRITQMLP